MREEDWIGEAVARIDREMSPSRVVLFGSRARADHRADSDADFLIVFPQEIDRRGTARSVRWLLRDIPMAFDVVVATEADLRHRGDQVGLVYRPALREGRVLLNYDRAT